MPPSEITKKDTKDHRGKILGVTLWIFRGNWRAFSFSSQPSAKNVFGEITVQRLWRCFHADLDQGAWRKAENWTLKAYSAPKNSTPTPCVMCRCLV